MFRILFSLFTLIATLNVFGAETAVYKLFDIRTESARPKITKLYRDRDGQIWAGTDHGVFKFDGVDFIKIPGTDSALFRSVTALYQSHDGILWAGFSGGKILKINHGRFTVYNPEEGFPKVPVTGFAEDKDKKLFFCTNGEGVYCIERNRMYNINEDDGISDNYCYSIIALDDGRVCVGTDAGLNFISFKSGKKSISIFNSGNELPDDIVRTILPAGDNQLWIGMQDKGVLLYDYSKNTITRTLKEPWTHGPVTGFETVDNELWIATEEDGIFILRNNSQTERFPLDLGRTFKPVNLIRDLENNVWIAESIHLIRTAGNKIRLIERTDSYPVRSVHCILKSRDGSLYFSPDMHLGKITPDGKAKLILFPGNKLTDIVSLYEDPEGFIWMGTMGSGIYRYNPKTGNIKHVFESSRIESASILSITGKGNEIWTGGFNGANRYVVENMESENLRLVASTDFPEHSKLTDDYIYHIFIDSKERIWFATDENGVFYLDEGKVKNLAIPGNTAHSFTEDPKGRIWIGTSESGIIVYSEDTLIRLEPKDGLSSPSVTALRKTEAGGIVMVYENGFDLIDPETFTIIYHSTEEGFSDLNANLNAITESENGIIYLGSEKGIIIYRPFSDNKLNRPKLILNTVSVFLEDIDFSQTTRLDHDQNNVRFDYTGLWYSDPKRISYYYMLEGYSGKWQQTKDRSITFPKLPAGKYVFRLRAGLGNTSVDGPEITYKFTITPPFWQSWWFRILMAAVLAASIFLMILQRDRRVRRQDREQKEKIEFQFQTLKSQVNPHFLFNSFNTLISVIEKQPQLAVEYVEKLSEFFRSIVNYRDKNLIPLPEELDLLENYIFIQKKRYGDNLLVQNRLNEESIRGYLIPPLVLQLLAENAIKHNAVSKETPLWIRLEMTNNALIISNNINPKYSVESSSGFGLQNIIGRYKLLTDEPVVVHKIDSIFTVTLPLINKSIV